MAIEINKSDSRIDPPTITLTGVLVTNGVYDTENIAENPSDEPEMVEESTSTVIDDQDVTEVSSNEFRNIDPLIFKGDVTVTLTPDTSFTANSYTNRSSTDIVGASEFGGNRGSETYYTTNGKSPLRTQSNLYTGAFTVAMNLSGSDNTILKARTYVNGMWSEIRTVEFSVIRNDPNVF